MLAVASALALYAAVITVTLIAAGEIITHIGPLTRWDERANRWFVDRRTPTWTTISFWGTFIANTLGVVVVASVITVVLAARRVGRIAAVAVCGLAIEIVVFLVTNYSVGRPRPHVEHLGSTPSTFSFPSGHAAATLVLYVGIAIMVFDRTRNRVARAVACVIAVTFPLWVGLSRIYRGQHHVTDVIAGFLMGAAALLCGLHALRHAPPTTAETQNGAQS